MDSQYDVVVVGGGNAALCAALAAAEQGASVALLERAPEAKRGGNSNFTGGGFRMVHHGAQDIKRIVPDLSEADIARTDFGECLRATAREQEEHGLEHRQREPERNDPQE